MTAVAKDIDIPIELLRECFDYDPATGLFTWRKRPRSHFVSDHSWRIFFARYVGRPAGTHSNRGYLKLAFTFDDRRWMMHAHRAAWALMTGKWPKNEIDHINRIRDDNRFVNLRDATHAENQHNANKRRNNTSGFVGVVWRGDSQKWIAQIRINRQHYFLGHFDDPAEAHAAYLVAKKRLHPTAPIANEVAS
jgi:hypothetical protein